MYLVTTPLNTLYFRLPFTQIRTKSTLFPLIAANIFWGFFVGGGLFTVQIMQRKHKGGTNKCSVLLHCAFYMC